MGALSFHPIYQKRIWGGDNLWRVLGRNVHKEGRIGESWEIVDRDEAMSVVDEGPMAGYSLRDLLKWHTEFLMGPGYPPNTPFPILVKWLDCQQRVSLQVHPSDEVAARLGGQPKAEHWYIATATSSAGVFIGLKDNVTHSQLEATLQSPAVESLICRQPTQSGDSIFVPSGCLHAIDAGNIILEIQQNSDTTYRIYDWGRLGSDGKPRPLHLDAALQSIDFENATPVIQTPKRGTQCLADCPAFRIRKCDLYPGRHPLSLAAGEQPRLLHIIEGQVEATTTTSEQSRSSIASVILEKGRNALLPFIDSFSLRAVARKAVVLITDNFYNPLCP